MNSRYSSFIKAFVIAVFIFAFGILVGVLIENSRADISNNLFFNSETSYFDFQLQSQMVVDNNASCPQIQSQAVGLADKIFSEAVQLENYAHSNQITSDLTNIHRRYDLLRTLLWNSLISFEGNCHSQFTIITYFYKYQSPDVVTDGVQKAMSNKLGDLKEEYGDKIILIPIAVDTGIDSLQTLMKKYNITKIPAILVDQKYKIDNINKLKGLDSLVSNSLE